MENKKGRSQTISLDLIVERLKVIVTAVLAAASAPSSLTSITALWRTSDILVTFYGSMNEKSALSENPSTTPRDLITSFKLINSPLILNLGSDRLTST